MAGGVGDVVSGWKGVSRARARERCGEGDGG